MPDTSFTSDRLTGNAKVAFDLLQERGSPIRYAGKDFHVVLNVRYQLQSLRGDKEATLRYLMEQFFVVQLFTACFAVFLDASKGKSFTDSDDHKYLSSLTRDDITNMMRTRSGEGKGQEANGVSGPPAAVAPPPPPTVPSKTIFHFGEFSAEMDEAFKKGGLPAVIPVFVSAMIRKALEQEGGDEAKAAEILEISLDDLRREKGKPQESRI
jgi:hypothetical protein